MIKIGSHVKMAGKEMLLGSAREAVSYGANTFMVYTGAPQNTKRKPVSELNIDAAKDYMKQNGIEDFVVHAPYIINLANTVNPDTYSLAVDFLALELERTAAMGSSVLVLHPGSHVGAGSEAGIRQIVRGLNAVLTPDTPVCLALETMAGKGSEIGRSFEELAAIYDGVACNDKLRVCFDTCHVNDAGYDLSHDYEGVFQHFDEVLGLGQIAVFHINDSMNPCGTHKDRHANIGKGYLGEEVLKKLVHDPRFEEIPKILETPWLCEEGSDKKTIPPYKEEIRQLLG